MELLDLLKELSIFMSNQGITESDTIDNLLERINELTMEEL